MPYYEYSNLVKFINKIFEDEAKKEGAGTVNNDASSMQRQAMNNSRSMMNQMKSKVK